MRSLFRKANHSLTAVVVEFDDGFYQLPRFEIPESLWETFDRMDPERTIVRIRDWERGSYQPEGRSARRRPKLYTTDPATFSLLCAPICSALRIRRSMLLGWHVEATPRQENAVFTRRSEIRAHLAHAYHCDHTRQATILNRRDRKENYHRRLRLLCLCADLA